MTSKKSHTRFRLVPKSTTLDDLEGPLRTVCFKTRASFGSHHDNLNENRLHYHDDDEEEEEEEVNMRK